MLIDAASNPSCESKIIRWLTSPALRQILMIISATYLPLMSFDTGRLTPNASDVRKALQSVVKHSCHCFGDVNPLHCENRYTNTH